MQRYTGADHQYQADAPQLHPSVQARSAVLAVLRAPDGVYAGRVCGYSPAYVRDDLTDDLHSTFGFRTDFEIVPYENFKKIFQQIKK